jgi:glycerate kinase
MAAASGLTLVSKGEQDPLRATSFGTGQLIIDALDRGANAIVLGLGGSATNDAGTGALEALGVRFLDAAGNPLKGNGENLERIAEIDVSGLDPRVAQARFTALCDVDSPLVGMNGATMMFGRQNGASDAGLQRLEHGMRSYLGILRSSAAGFDEMPGDGAAGGMGLAARIFLRAGRKRGADWILDSVGFDRALQDADLCITGEGHADGQSSKGKLVSRIAKRCQSAGVPCIAVVGGMDESARGLESCGVNAIYPSVTDCCSREEAMRHAERNFRLAVDRALIAMEIGLNAGRQEPGSE